MATMEQGESSGLRLPKFIKVYFPQQSGNDLELPTFLNSSLPKPLPTTVTVCSIYGKKWKLALRKCSVHGETEKCVLANGWKRIAKDEGVTSGDFFEFEFDGSTSFNFCIYKGDTMCKRVRQSSVANDEECDDDNVIVLTSDDESNDVDYNDVDDDIESVDDDFVDADDEDDVNDDDEADDVNDDDDDYRQYLDDGNNPSFSMTLNPKKTSQLHIPAQVIKDYCLNFPESITVVDPLAQKFGSLEKKIKIQGNGSVFVKGFGSVIRRNNVKLADKMVFELKKTGNNLVHTIKVYVING